MAGAALPSLTNVHVLALRRKRRGRLTRLADTVRGWRRRARERQALAGLSDRELADFGATTADVYRELNAPFWRSLPPY